MASGNQVGVPHFRASAQRFAVQLQARRRVGVSILHDIPAAGLSAVTACWAALLEEVRSILCEEITIWRPFDSGNVFWPEGHLRARPKRETLRHARVALQDSDIALALAPFHNQPHAVHPSVKHT